MLFIIVADFWWDNNDDVLRGENYGKTKKTVLTLEVRGFTDCLIAAGSGLTRFSPVLYENQLMPVSPDNELANMVARWAYKHDRSFTHSLILAACFQSQ